MSAPTADPAVTKVSIRGGDERAIRDAARIIMALLDTRGVDERVALTSRPRVDIEVVATPMRKIAERMRAGLARIDEQLAAEELRDTDRDLRPATCVNGEVCDWTGVVDDLDSPNDCPQCFEPTVRYDITPA